MSIEAIKAALAAYSNSVDAVNATQEGDDPHAAALAVQGVERAQEVWKTWTQPEYIAPLIDRMEAAELKVQELRGDHVPTPDDISAQDWSGMDGAIAYHLIDRHAENWSHIGRLMHAWRDAAIAAAKSAGELPPTHHSPPSEAHPGLYRCAHDVATKHNEKQ